MTQSRLTINILTQYVADFGKTLDFLRKLDPVAVVAGIDSMNAANRVYELQQALPQAKVIGRYIFSQDGAMHMKPQAVNDNRKYIVSPLDALDEVSGWGKLGKDGRMLYLANEPMANGASQDDIARLSAWSLETIQLASERGISLCLLNLGVGHPMLMGNGEYDARFDDVLTALSKNRDTIALGMHVYQPADTFTRLDGLIKRCKTLGIKPPKVHITEAGFDAGSGGDTFNGYKSRGFSGAQFAAFQIDKLRNVYSPYIVDDVLQSIATFCWGNEASWKNFNVEPDTDWQATILAAKERGDLSIEKKPPVVIPTPPAPPQIVIPAGKGIAKPLVIAGKSSWNLRSDADIHAAEVGLVKVGEAITLYPSSITPNGGNNYYYIERANPPAGESANGWIAYILPVTAPLPTPPAPAPPADNIYSRLYAAQLKVAQAQFELAQVYKELSQLDKAA